MDITTFKKNAIVQVSEINSDGSQCIIISPHFEDSKGNKIKSFKSVRINDNLSLLFFDLLGCKDPLIYTYNYKVKGRDWFLKKYPTLQEFNNVLSSGQFKIGHDINELDLVGYPNCKFVEKISTEPNVKIKIITLLEY